MKDTKKMTMKEKALYYEEMAGIEENVRGRMKQYVSYYNEEQDNIKKIEAETREECYGDEEQIREHLDNNWSYQNGNQRAEEYMQRINALNLILDKISEM